MLRFSLLIMFIVVSQFVMFSQDRRTCGFDEERMELQKDPKFVKQELEFEKKIQKILKNQQENRSNTFGTVPVVVHVLHLGEAPGTGTNIATAQIQSSIDHLNEFYGGLTANSPIDFEIEFALAQRDPDCASTTGIVRVDASGVPNYEDYGIYRSVIGANQNDLKDLSRWPETDYFNVWIVTEIDDNNGGSGVQGWASFYGGNEYEGSVMMYTVFGYDPDNNHPAWPLSYSRDNSTVVHEVGHYFHLYHTFQGDTDGSTCPADITCGTDSDCCADTEPHKRLFGCPPLNDCNSDQPYEDNTLHNIMSYFDCTDRLTPDQKTRVQAAMSGTSIISSLGYLAPDPTYAAPVGVCSPNTVMTHVSGLYAVELNGKTFESGSSQTDGGNIDNSGNCSNYFQIDAPTINTVNVEVFSVNWQQLGVWIDWNDDGDFDDDNELQYLEEDIAAGTIVPVQLKYPAAIPYNDWVRIRLITDTDNRYGTPNITSPCHTGLVHGQSEDYAIKVNPVEIASNSTCQSFTAGSVSGNDWVYLLNGSDELIASINPNGNDLGTVTCEFKVDNAIINSTSNELLPRHWNFSCDGPDCATSTFGQGNITMRMYIREGDWNAFTAATSTTSASDINFIHYEDPGEDCDETNNTSGTSTLITTVTDAMYTTATGDHVSFEFDAPGFSEFSGTSETTLPIELIYFSANRQDGMVELRWTTASEYASEYFEIERSDDGHNWSSIDRVSAKGNSSSKTDYQRIDRSPLSGNNYYRLKEVDSDRSSTYSNIRMVSFEKSELEVFPNPVTDQLHIKYSKDVDAEIVVFNMLGTPILSLSQSLNQPISTSDLTSGVYTIMVSVNGTDHIHRIVKK